MDQFSYVGLLTAAATVYYLLFDTEQFLSNMEKPINLIFWLVLISYPVFRYFIPFHVYTLDSTGISLKGNNVLLWTDMRDVSLYDNYEQEKDQDAPIFRVELTIKTDTQTYKIKFSNYTMQDKKLRKEVEKHLSKKLKMKDVLPRIFMSFYEKNKLQ